LVDVGTALRAFAHPTAAERERNDDGDKESEESRDAGEEEGGGRQACGQSCRRKGAGTQCQAVCQEAAGAKKGRGQ
jgi:hypothetical protein